MQEIWLSGKNWDDQVPANIQEKWVTLTKNIHELESLQMPRWIGFNLNQVLSLELHAFCDASQKAYASVVYLKVQSTDGCQTQLLASKTKIAPLKPVSLPRLELCAALLAVKLILLTLSETSLNISKIFVWSDSRVVLSWLKGPPYRWKTFVANRVGEIHQRLPNADWRYVPSLSNPADIPSRGMEARKLIDCSLWWKGPSWLPLPPENWPKIEVNDSIEIERKNVHVAEVNPDLTLSEKFSSFSKLVRVVAFCLRFINNCKTNPDKRNLNYLTVTEIDNSVICLIHLAQNQAFSSEIKAIQKGNPIPAKSKLLSLSPFLDDKNILRLGGRLQNSKLSFSEMHPIILASDTFSKLLIQKTHIETLHGGTQLVLSILRRNYWIIGARKLTKQIIHRCMPCFRQRTKSLDQQMGILPFPRVNISRPFSNCGIDYFGPVELKSEKKRKSTTYKGYVSLFICFATRAIHLELVTDQTTEAFIAALRRFISRRGLCSNIYSDQGTTFKGASNALQKDFQQTIKKIELIAAGRLANDQITWHFIPPASPHFGGLWEAGVKSTKFHLKRILSDVKFTYEEMATVLSQVEATLNSRPLCPLTDDPNDFSALTPGHFLVGGVLTLPPEPCLLDLKENRLNRWQKLQHLYQHFWDRWYKEHLSRLQARPKWARVKPNVSVGELVLVMDKNVPPAKWLLARVLEVHEGTDRLVRVATIKTKENVLKRPIVKLCKLPFY